MNNLVVILIIAHKQFLNENEISSLKQCQKILGKHKIILICPDNLNLTEYQRIAPQIQIDVIESKWQSNYRMFNKLKIDSLLYKKYSGYQYILFYELDSWVFKDDLALWCKKGFDYIGAPWFKGWHEDHEEKHIIGVGNGGLSLRDVRKSLTILKRITILRWIYKFSFYKEGEANYLLKALLYILSSYLNVKDQKKIPEIIVPQHCNEDFFWCMRVAKVFSDYKVSPISEAIKFSFETNPRLLYDMNNRELPFGCHAWERYDPEFWKPYIS